MRPLLGRLCVFLTFISIIEIVHASGQEQVWSYDFGNFTGVKTAGDDLHFISQNQTDGGILRVRTAVNNDGRNIHISDAHNEIGTYSRMILDAGATGARNIFEIQDFDATDLLYLKTTIKIRAEGPNNLEIFAGNENSAGNVLSLGNLVAGIRFSVQEDQDSGELLIDKQRKSGTGTGISSAHDFNLNLVELDKKHIVEIYVNNSFQNLFYYRNGISFPLNSDQQAYWIDGNFVAAGPGSTNGNHQGSPVETGEIISVIRFLGGSNGGGKAFLEIDDILYANHFPVLRDITGGEGWRMLAVSSNGFSIESLNRQNHVQGITGAAIEAGVSNVYTFNPSDPGNPWVKPGNTTEIIDPGRGFLWYIYDNADYLPSKPLPFSLLSNGSALQSDVTVPLYSDMAGNFNGHTNNTWNLLGNPFGMDIRLDMNEGLNAWVSGGSLASVTAQVWQSSGNYKVINAGESIAAFQGFFIHNNDAPEIDIPFDVSADYNTEFQKQLTKARLIGFRLEAIDSNTGEVFTDEAFQLYFHANAGHEWDLRDAQKIIPFSSRYVNIAFVGDSNGDFVLKAQDSRPFDPGRKVSVPVELHSAGVGGTATISVVRYENIPPDWIIEIEDKITGALHFLDSNSSYTFNFNSNLKARYGEDDLTSAQDIMNDKNHHMNPRFIIHVQPGLPDDRTLIPDKVELHQNYPNPFNPFTIISFDLPVSSEVYLAVYDILGREVTTLKNGSLEAGTHFVSFDASNLSSGVYLYRLTSVNTIISRKLTILK